MPKWSSFKNIISIPEL